MVEDLGLFGIKRDWGTAALDPGVWNSTVREGGCGFVAAWWAKEEEKAFKQRQRKIEAEEADKVEVAPGVTVASLRRLKIRVDWTDPRAHQAASSVPTEKHETLK